MSKTEKELVIKWYDKFTSKAMTEEEATEFIIDCETAEMAEKVMRLIAIRYRYLDI